MNPASVSQGYEPHDRLLTFDELGELVSLRSTAVKALVRRPGFPPPLRLSRRTPRWWRSEVEAWLESQRCAYNTASERSYCSTRRRRTRRYH